MRTISVRGKVVDFSRGNRRRGRFPLLGVGLLAAVLLVGLERPGRAQQPAVSETGKPSTLLPEVPLAGRAEKSPNRLVLSVRYVMTAPDTAGWMRRKPQLAVLLDGKPTPLKGLAAVLKRKVESFAAARGCRPKDVTVVIHGDRRVPAGTVGEVLQATLQAGLKQSCLAVNAEALCAGGSITGGRATGEFVLRPLLAAPREGLPLADQLPPISIRLRATEDGRLGRIIVGNRVLRDLNHLRHMLRDIVGDAGAEMAKSIEVDLSCDAALRYRYLLEAVSTVFGYVDTDARFHRLVGEVRLVISPGPPWRVGMGAAELEREEVVEVEELVEELEVLPEEIEILPEQMELEEPEPPMIDDPKGPPIAVELSEFGPEKVPRSGLLDVVGASQPGALSGRGRGKGALVASAGGNEASERAVASALKWLAEHQLPDGGWSFNHSIGPKCRGQCRNPGNLPEARNAATGLALLAFLGAGQTHKVGVYKSQVKGGLYFLVSHMKLDDHGGSLYESGGSMYSHGICAIALCEAYAMTHDKGLYGPAQQAINFIAYVQDPVGGGWRYQPRQKGDTSVAGWQITALKTGHMGYLRVPPLTVKKAFTFLDSVQADSGANYGYTTPGSGSATTAIGLLCRMYMGWKKDNPALVRGVEWLSERGPSKGNVYYNYYATQVMRHWEGDEWKKWNAVMRDQLVDSQATTGHETGSWHFDRGDHGAGRGGRLYCTAMATMILEIYYRHLSIYRKQSTEDDFPED